MKWFNAFSSVFMAATAGLIADYQLQQHTDRLVEKHGIEEPRNRFGKLVLAYRDAQDNLKTPTPVSEISEKTDPVSADEVDASMFDLQKFVDGIQFSKEEDRDGIFKILSEHAQAHPDFKSQVSGFLENEDRPAIEIVEGQMFDPIQPLYQNGDDHEQLDEFTEENGILRRYRINRALLVGTEERETGLPTLAEFTGISQFSGTETIEVFDAGNVISILNSVLPPKPPSRFELLSEEIDTDLTDRQVLEFVKG